MPRGPVTGTLAKAQDSLALLILVLSGNIVIIIRLNIVIINIITVSINDITAPTIILSIIIYIVIVPTITKITLYSSLVFLLLSLLL